jgi:ParB-like chromosome segregation protein Spo0J
MATARDASVKVTDEVRTVSELKVDPKNARRHSEQQIARIAQSIERFGYVNKIAIKPTNEIIGGHTTLEALKRLGRDKIEVRVVAGLTPAQYKALAIALNKLPEGSSRDDGILAEIVGELDEAQEDVSSLGFSERELKTLRDGADPLEVKEIETSDVEDEFWISIRGPLASQADVLKALEAATKPYGGVTVDLGTIALG